MRITTFCIVIGADHISVDKILVFKSNVVHLAKSVVVDARTKSLIVACSALGTTTQFTDACDAADLSETITPIHAIPAIHCVEVAMSLTLSARESYHGLPATPPQHF